MDIKIEELQRLCKDETLFITQHALNRFRERKIKYADIKHIIMTGEIIEQ